MDRAFSIDRFEGALAVLVPDGGMPVHVLAERLPPDAREGDRVSLVDRRWTIQRAETDGLRAELFELQECLFDE